MRLEKNKILSRPGIRQKMKMAGRPYPGRRHQILIHQINIFKPFLLQEFPEAGGLDHVARRPDRVGQKAWTEINPAESALEIFRRVNAHCRFSEDIGGHLIEFVDKNMFSPAELETFRDGIDLTAAPPAVFLIQNRNRLNIVKRGSETFLNRAFRAVSRVDRPGNAVSRVKKIFGNILKPRQAVPGNLRLEYQQIRISVVRHIMLFFPSAAFCKQDG